MTPKTSHWRESVMLAWDIGIIVLVSINLALILFDSLFAIDPIGQLIHTASPTFHDSYARLVHARFATIDLGFVCLFLIDVGAGWITAIAQKRYHRWFFYPFIHWYDVLGCIPISGFRLLRVLRVITIGFRLQRLGVIDIRHWHVYATFHKYYEILVEEVSDRVVVNVLSGIQEEVRSGGDTLSQRVVREVIYPRRDALVNTISDRVADTVRNAYDNNHDDIRGYIAYLVNSAVNDNTLARNIDRMPMLGRTVTRLIDDTITDTVANVIGEAVAGMQSDEYRNMIHNITDSVFDRLVEGPEVDRNDLIEAIIEIIDLLKEQVRVQRWKDTYA